MKKKVDWFGIVAVSLLGTAYIVILLGKPPL